MENKFKDSRELLKTIKKSPGHETFILDEKEVREGAYCTQCGKYIPEGEWYSRDGERVRYFFGFKRDEWYYYFCSEECDKKFWKKKTSTIKPKSINVENEKNK